MPRVRKAGVILLQLAHPDVDRLDLVPARLLQLHTRHPNRLHHQGHHHEAKADHFRLPIGEDHLRLQEAANLKAVQDVPFLVVDAQNPKLGVSLLHLGDRPPLQQVALPKADHFRLPIGEDHLRLQEAANLKVVQDAPFLVQQILEELRGEQVVDLPVQGQALLDLHGWGLLDLDQLLLLSAFAALRLEWKPRAYKVVSGPCGGQ